MDRLMDKSGYMGWGWDKQRDMGTNKDSNT